MLQSHCRFSSLHVLCITVTPKRSLCAVVLLSSVLVARLSLKSLSSLVLFQGREESGLDFVRACSFQHMLFWILRSVLVIAARPHERCRVPSGSGKGGISVPWLLVVRPDSISTSGASPSRKSAASSGLLSKMGARDKAGRVA